MLSSSYSPCQALPVGLPTLVSYAAGFLPRRLSSKGARRIALFAGAALLLAGVHGLHQAVIKVQGIAPANRLNVAHIYLPTWMADFVYPIAPPVYFLEEYKSITSLSNPPLASYACPTLHLTSTEGDHSRRTVVNPFMLLATFSIAENFETRRMLRGRRRFGLLPKDDALLETKFVIGSLPPLGPDEDALAREQLEAKLKEEEENYGDLMRLGMEENMDGGKTYEFIKFVYKRGEENGPKPQFTVKVDEDTILNLPNLLDYFSTLDCNEGVYWGTTTGSWISGCYPKYFQGLAYGLSYPLLAHLAHSNISIDHSNGTEDARTGSWMPAVDRRTRLGRLAGEEGKGKMVQWKDVGSMLGGEGPFDTQSPNWIGKHAYKDKNLWLARWSSELTFWAKAGKPFVWFGGDNVAHQP